MDIQMAKKKGWQVLFAGLGINLTLGVVYSWSVIKSALVNDWGWSNSEASLPYSVAIVVWALTLLVAGRMQDKIGPKKVVTLGAALTASGLILSSFSQNPTVMVFTFGVLSGAGIGFAYASVTPPALKWFHASKKGMVTGIVVSGMGLASLYIAPATTVLLAQFGPARTFVILGVFITVVALPIAQLIQNPPKDYVPEVPSDFNQASGKKKNQGPVKDYSWREMMRTKQFYYFWLMFAFASSAGLMIIGNIAMIAKTQAGLEKGFFLVGLLAIFNACGRLAAGFLSDQIGRVRTMMIVFALQGVNMMLFISYSSFLTISIGTALAGLSYGALLSLFPSVVADYYGVKNFGGNYGVLYSAWGFSGIIGPIIAGVFVDMTGTYHAAYLFSAGLLAIAFTLALFVKPVAQMEKISITPVNEESLVYEN